MQAWLTASTLAVALVSAAAPAGAVPVVRYETSSPAALTVTGNSLGLSGDAGGPSTDDRIGAFIDAALTLQVPGWPLGTTDDWLLASSDAVLDLPEDATILYAELVWGGTLDADGSVPDALGFDAVDAPVDFVTPSGLRHAVAPDPATAAELGASVQASYYGRSANVTALIEGAGTYRVGAVPSTLAGSDPAAGWSLYVVYRHDALPPRRIALLTFMTWVDASADNADVTAEVDGLCIQPVAADRQARIALTAIDGDANSSGDSFRLARQQGQLNGDGARVTAFGATQDNLFGGRITGNDGLVDVRGSFGNANHGAANNVAGARQGWDVLTVQANAFLQTNWSSAWLRASAVNDQHGLLAVGVSLGLRTPYLPDVDALVASTEEPSPSGIVTFTTTLRNTGDLAAADARFKLIGGLPDGISFVAGSFAIDGVAPSGTVGAAELLAGVDLGTLAAGSTQVVTLQLSFAAPTIAQWSFTPRVTYTNAECAGARTDPFAPTPIVFTFGATPTPTCGDGKREGDEACDDGDTSALDGCSATCRSEVGFTCRDNPDSLGTPAAPDSICGPVTAICGDGIFEAGSEGCDDGGRLGRDGCSASCTVEAGWLCDNASGRSVCSEDCGDGEIIGAELCDDGHPQGEVADGCSANCRSIDHGWACLGEPSNCRARCGDFLIARDVEVCDDGNRVGGDGCSADCSAIELGWACRGEPSRCATACGDGTLRVNEECDDGGLVDGDGCSSACRFETTWICSQPSIDSATICRRDSDEDGVLDDGDESGDPSDNPCPENGPGDNCDDNCPAFPNADQSFPLDNLFCPVYVGPRTRGGGGCAGGAEIPLALAVVALIGLASMRRGRKSGHAGILFVTLTAFAATSSDTRAQEVDPRLFEPTLSPLGVLGVETSATSGHLRPWVNLVSSMADDELSTRTGPSRISSGPLDYRFLLTFGAGIGLFDRFDVAVGFPLAIAETAKFGEVSDSDMGMTDLRFLLRGRIFGPGIGGDGPGLALALHTTFPTGSDTPYMSDGAVTIMPQVVLDYRSSDGFLAALNVGFRFRPERTIVDLTIANELRFGLGAEVPVGFYGFAFTAELDGAVSLGDSAYDNGGISAREMPIEVLGGMRWRSGGGVTVTGAVGSGVTEGYGAPDFRVLFGLAFNVPAPEKYEEPIVPASRNERRDDWNTRAPVDNKKGPPVTDAQFDKLAADDLDSDGDGVPIPRDVCPDVPEDRDGFNDEDGCPDPDDDEDGVLDADDKCPNELEVLNGVDDYDGCYDEPKPVDGNGIKDNQIEIKDRIRFKAGSAELLPSDKLILDQVALVMRANSKIKRFRIEGHTDNLGDREFNVDLAERRAWSVRTYLIDKGIDESRLFPKGFGSTRPVAKNTTEAGRAQNRRVEFHVIRDGEPSEGDVP